MALERQLIEPTAYMEGVVRAHERAATLRVGASLCMWLFAAGAFVGGLGGAQIQRLVFKGNSDEVVAAEALLEDQGKRIRDVRQGPDGALWALTDDTGEVLRITPHKY